MIAIMPSRRLGLMTAGCGSSSSCSQADVMEEAVIQPIQNSLCTGSASSSLGEVRSPEGGAEVNSFLKNIFQKLLRIHLYIGKLQ